MTLTSFLFFQTQYPVIWMSHSHVMKTSWNLKRCETTASTTVFEAYKKIFLKSGFLRKSPHDEIDKCPQLFMWKTKLTTGRCRGRESEWAEGEWNPGVWTGRDVHGIFSILFFSLRLFMSHWIAVLCEESRKLWDDEKYFYFREGMTDCWHFKWN